jgi:hypothetical protein
MTYAKLPKHLQKLLTDNPSDKDWKKGDCGFVAYRYSQDSCSAVPAIVTRDMDDRALLTVKLPGLFGNGFEALCYPFQVYATLSKARLIAKQIEIEHADDDGEF